MISLGKPDNYRLYSGSYNENPRTDDYMFATWDKPEMKKLFLIEEGKENNTNFIVTINGKNYKIHLVMIELEDDMLYISFPAKKHPFKEKMFHVRDIRNFRIVEYKKSKE